MRSPFDTARLILLFVSATYLLSAAILAVVRARGTAVPAWVIGTWVVTGLAGAALAWNLAPYRPAVWVGLLVVLGPWMAHSLYTDVRGGMYAIAVTDVLGLAAIAYALAITRAETFA